MKINNQTTNKSFVNPTKFVSLFFLSIFFINTTWSQNYYVAQNGNDNNPGTQAQPWETLNKVSSFSFNTGDKVYLKRGDTFHGNLLNIKWEGTPNDPAIVGAYGSGSRPIVSFDAPVQANHYGINTPSASKHLIVENIELVNAGLSLRGAGSKDYTVRNVKVTNSRGAAIFLQQVDGYLVENCEVDKAGNNGIAVWGSEAPLAKNGIIRNNVVHHGKSNDGIVLHQDGSGNGVGANHLILNNVSYNNPEQGYDITAGSYVLLKDNVSYDNPGGSVTIGHSGNHIMIDGHSSNGEGDWTFAIGMGGDFSEYLTVRNSLIVNPTTYGIRLQANTKYAAIANNTIVYGGELEQNRPIIAMQGNFTDVTAKNNILISTNNTPNSYVGYLNGRTPSNTNSDFDYNYYYRPDNQQNLFNGQSFANWQSSENQDSHGMYISPLFTNLSSGDYTLSSNSPCIDAGGPLTTTIGSGSGTQVPVKVAYFFFDGFDLTNGDQIIIGNNSPVTVQNVDYDNNILTINQSISWNAGDGVSLPYNGLAPDIGAFESGGTLGTNEFDNIDIAIYPNPSRHNEITIKLPQTIKIKTIKIYDITGKEVFTKKMETSKNKITLNPNLPFGIYFLKINSDKGLLSKKVIIE